ncbi:hypothetical protein [Cryptosporangium sp. NPDC051539]|uniref:hypothetical protein n=1 Tax=Cryptosporangium sp. NPDC051539 TaxID=3363962 RepID=UPI0037B3FD33
MKIRRFVQAGAVLLVAGAATLGLTAPAQALPREGAVCGEWRTYVNTDLYLAQVANLNYRFTEYIYWLQVAAADRAEAKTHGCNV